MAKKRMTVSFTDEATVKIQALSIAKRISFAMAANEMILRGSDAFQVEVHFLTEQVNSMSTKVARIETNIATITDILSSMAGSVNVITQKIR